MLDGMGGPRQTGVCVLIAAVCAVGCLETPPGARTTAADGAAQGPDGSPGPDAPLPVCGDGTALTLAHVTAIQIPDVRSSIPLTAMAVFVNRGTTTIDTGQIAITQVSTIGSASLAIGIANGGEPLPPGEAHGVLDNDSRPLMEDLIGGTWSDQSRPEVLGSIVHVITGGTFQATIDYRLGDYAAEVLLEFSVAGPTDATAGEVFDLACP
jgi:hypothetical protein